MEPLNKQVQRIIETADDAYGDLFEACNDLYQSLLNLTGINADAETNRQNLSLNSGNAIGLTWAAMCIRDIMRTKRFMLGITKATEDCLRNNPKRPIHILYAGTGPFATLMLPLVAQFDAEVIQFTLLEINANSFECLRNLVEKLRLDKYVRRMENADATEWKLPAHEEVDIFICETMTQALQSEPQVAICLNIIPQLHPQTIVIPERVLLRAALLTGSARMKGLRDKDRLMDEEEEPALKRKNNSEDEIIEVAEILLLHRKTIRELAAIQDKNIARLSELPPVTVNIDPEVSKTHTELYILTDVTIYGHQKLLMNESALTLPLKLIEIQNSTSIQLQYIMGKNPGIRVKRL